MSWKELERVHFIPLRDVTNSWKHYRGVASGISQWWCIEVWESDPWVWRLLIWHHKLTCFRFGASWTFFYDCLSMTCRLCTVFSSCICFAGMNKDSVRLPLSKQKIEVHDKKQACPFCERLVSKFAEHIEVHKSEPTVAQLQNLTTKGSKERKSRLTEMRKRGEIGRASCRERV